MVTVNDLPEYPCEGCAECPLRGRPYVAPDGPQAAEVLVIGEAPGAAEAAEGRPFVGASGRMLRRELGYAGLPEARYLNVVQCRPEKNRDPRTAEIQACSTLVAAELRASHAKVVLAVGRFALNRLLGQAPEARSRSGAAAWRSTLLARRATWQCYAYEWGKEVNNEALIGKHRVRQGDLLKTGPNAGKRKLVSADAMLEVPRPRGCRGVVAVLHPAAAMRPAIGVPAWARMPVVRAAIANAGRLYRGTKIYRGPSQVVDSVDRLHGAKELAFDIETDMATGRITEIGFATFPTLNESSKVLTLPWNREAREATESLFRSAKTLAAHNASFDVEHLLAEGVAVPEEKLFCTMMAAYVLQSDLPKSLGCVAPMHFLMAPWKHQPEAPQYNAIDVHITALLAVLLRRRMRAEGSYAAFAERIMPGLRAWWRMTAFGMPVDADALRAWKAELHDQLEELYQKWERWGANPRSPKQLAALLYGKLGLPILKRTAKGSPSTDRETLARLAARSDHPVLRTLMRIRDREKQISTYAKEMTLCPKGRVHPKFLPHLKDAGNPEEDGVAFGTATMRPSATDPNILNQPPRARFVYVPHAEGMVIWSADWSQIEARIVAYRAREAWLMDAFESGTDVHALAAEQMSRVSGLAISRQQGKIARHAANYLAGPKTLARTLQCSVEDAESILAAIAKAEPRVAAQRAADVAFARKNLYIASPFGLRRWFYQYISPRWRDAADAGAQVVNYNPQSIVAMMVWTIIWPLYSALRRIDARLYSNTYDDFVGACYADDVEHCEALVRHHMERKWPELGGAFEERGWYCPIDFAVGPTWGDCKKFEAIAKEKACTPVEAWISAGRPAAALAREVQQC